MSDIFRDFLKEVKPIKFKEPLAETLGAFKEEGAAPEYTFVDAVKMAGHACPTVAGAYLSCKKALEVLYVDEIPVRGGRFPLLFMEKPTKGFTGSWHRYLVFLLAPSRLPVSEVWAINSEERICLNLARIKLTLRQCALSLKD